MITPRPYQQDVIDGAVKLWRAGRRRIAAVLATGAGKTVVFSFVAKMAHERGLPTLVLAHRKELLDQAIGKLTDVNPGARVGRLQGSVKQYRADIVVGSVQTASTPTSLALLKTRRWGLVIVDEVHHGVADTYMRIARELNCFDDDGPLLLGVTATLDRSDGLAMSELIEEVIEPTVGLLDLIRQGYLVPPRGVRVRIDDLDLRKVRRTAGDLNAGQLGAAMSAAMAPQRLVEAWEEHAKGRPTIAFLPTVAVSIEQAEAFRTAGYRAVHLDGTTADAVRDAVLDDYRAGRIDVLCNVNLFGEGTDLPMCSCVILRMTSSRTVYQQQVGRGLRLHPGKTNCIILDPAGVTGRHKLATLANLDGAARPEDIPDELLMYEDDLAEVVDEAPDHAGGESPSIDYADGDLSHELIDLFGQSHSAWLRTDGGVWFLPVPDGFIYLAPRGDDRYDLRWGTQGRMGHIQYDMEIGYAMAAGDAYVAERPIWQLHRDAPWRATARGAEHDRKARIRASKLLDRPSR